MFLHCKGPQEPISRVKYQARSDSPRKAKLLQLHGPGSASSEAEGVLPSGIHTPSACVHLTYTAGHRPQTDTQSTYMNTGSTSSLIPLPSLGEDDRGPLVIIYRHTHVDHVVCLYICICDTMWIPPAAGLGCSVFPVVTPASPPPHLLAHGHMSPQGHSHSPGAATNCCTHRQMHTHACTGSWTRLPWFPRGIKPSVLLILETNTYADREVPLGARHRGCQSPGGHFISLPSIPA